MVRNYVVSAAALLQTDRVRPRPGASRENNAKVTAEQRENAVEQLQVFKRWIWKHVFEMDDKGESRTLMIVPHGRPGANYRDVEAQPGGR